MKKVQNKTNKVEVVFVLDRSGSMENVVSDTIGGFNSMINKQKKESPNALVTTVLFDDKIEILHDRVAINDVPALTNILSHLHLSSFEVVILSLGNRQI